LFEGRGGQDGLSYLREIVDAAQENHPHLWVNGEKYVFSDDVTSAAHRLTQTLRQIKQAVAEPLKPSLKSELLEILAVFDKSYSEFEQFYIFELMVIERDARRFIVEAIRVEQQMQEMESELVQSGANVYEDEAYNELRAEFIGLLAQINAVTNVNGKGRDDLTDIQILRAAETIGKDLKPG
jgi:hypothetical protein